MKRRLGIFVAGIGSYMAAAGDIMRVAGGAIETVGREMVRGSYTYPAFHSNGNIDQGIPTSEPLR